MLINLDILNHTYGWQWIGETGPAPPHPVWIGDEGHEMGMEAGIDLHFLPPRPIPSCLVPNLSLGMAID